MYQKLNIKKQKYRSKIKNFVLLSGTLLLFAFQDVDAQVVINEFSSASDPEWIELFNSGSGIVSLQGYSIFLDDNPSTTQKYTFCGNDQILGNSYRLINRPQRSFWLANSGDSIILKNGSTQVDSISYGNGQPLVAPEAVQSATRNPDGASNWVISDSPSSQGDLVSFTCPTPTPIPTPTPTSAPTPTAIPIVTPKATATPIKTSTSTPASTLTVQGTHSPTSPSSYLPSVLGKSEDTVSAKASPLVLGLGILLLVIGLSLVAIAVLGIYLRVKTSDVLKK